MPSLRELRSRYAPLLLIDAASAVIQVGALVSVSAGDRWTRSSADAGTGIFENLAALPMTPADCGAFIYCDGPGSILGVRSAAAALRAWLVIGPRPVFAYHSLSLVARSLAQPGQQVIADARRGFWHRCAGSGSLERVPDAELGENLLMPEGFRHWSPLPPGVATTSYDLPSLLARAQEEALFTETNEPDAFLHEEPSYVTWTPHVHRSP